MARVQYLIYAQTNEERVLMARVQYLLYAQTSKKGIACS